MKQLIKKIRVNNYIMRFITAWLVSGIVMIHEFGRDRMYEFESLKDVNLFAGVVTTVSVFVFLSIVNLVFRKNRYIRYYDYRKKASIIDYTVVMPVVVIFAVECMLTVKNVYSASMLCLIVAWILWYVLNTFKEFYFGKTFSKKTSGYIAFGGVLFGFCFVGFFLGTLLIVRHLIYRTATYDFGIFSQMYYYMKTTLKPMTTCERNELLSHFAVHVSPIFYVILPVYCIFPYEKTLIIMQLLIVLSGAIPLFLLAKKKGLGNFIAMCMSLLYLTYPTFCSGLFYDFHENKFLPVLILWLLYFMESEKVAGTLIFAILTLMVKEDAAIYVACIGLFMIFGKKGRKNKISGTVLVIASVVYFFMMYHFLSTSGDGAMISRYGNFVTKEEGTIGLLINIFKNPPYFISQIMSMEKLETFLWLFGPVLFIPFISRKAHSFILLIPVLVITFMTNNLYQWTIDYQYAYGSGALILYITVLYLSGELRDKRNEPIPMERLKISGILMVAVSVIMVTSVTTDKLYYLDDYKDNKDIYEEFNRVLKMIPEDASVSSTTFFIPHIPQRKEIYYYKDGEPHFDTEYYIYDLRYEENYDLFIHDYNEFLAEQYDVVEEIPDTIVLLKKSE